MATDWGLPVFKAERSLILILIILGLLAACGGRPIMDERQETRRIQHPPPSSERAEMARLGDFAIEGGEARMSSLFSVASPVALALSLLYPIEGVGSREYGDNKKLNYVVTSESASLNSPQGAGNFPATTMTGLSDGAALTFIVKADHETGIVSA